jgi:NAD(P)-dependent dehydrogenase (short-subunit alcohol dehydrogenase family)
MMGKHRNGNPEQWIGQNFCNRGGSKMGSSFQDKVVVVTGASLGIGKAVTMMLLERGAKVVASSRSEKKLEALRVSADRWQDSLLATTCDVSRQDDVEAMVAEGVKRFGRIDALVNNAGLYPTTPLLDLSEQEWDRVLDTNLKGPFMCTKAVVREMIARKVKGHIVNISSAGSLISRPGTAHYASSKAGMNALTKVLAIELAPHGIKVNCVLPGLIMTEGLQEHIKDTSRSEHQAKLDRIPLGIEGDPRDIAKAVLHLMSDEANYTTGSLLVVDGGYSLGISAYR